MRSGTKLFIGAVLAAVVAVWWMQLIHPSKVDGFSARSANASGGNLDMTSAPEAAVSTEDLHAGEREDPYCCCTRGAIAENVGPLLRILNRLVQYPQLRYFRARLDEECPYWAAHVLCMSADNPCAVCSCDEDALPLALLEQIEHEPLPASCSDPTATASLVSSEAAGHVRRQGEQHVGDESIVDLVVNPESNTGYTGEMANKVWDAIYHENCVPLYANHGDGREDSGNSPDDVVKPPVCSELVLLHRLISGLHTSISTHISVHYHPQLCGVLPIDEVLNVSYPAYAPNEAEMHKRVLTEPHRIENLILLYQFVLRAVAKLELRLNNKDSCSPGGRFFSGSNASLDAQFCNDLAQLYSSSLLCTTTFDEDAFLASPFAREILPQMVRSLTNVSTLMNCLTCEKCRLWGKLQTTGIMAAFRVVLGRPLDATTSDGDSLPLLSLREEVALLNLLRQLSLSVAEVAHRVPLK